MGDKVKFNALSLGTRRKWVVKSMFLPH